MVFIYNHRVIYFGNPGVAFVSQLAPNAKFANTVCPALSLDLVCLS